MLYKVKMEIVNLKCLQLITQNNSNKWHARLGHIGVDLMMIKKDLVIGLPNITFEKETCADCLLGKQARASFPNVSTFRASRALELVYGDLCGRNTPPSAGISRYIFLLIDDYSRYMWSILLQDKSDAFEKFEKFKAFTRNGGARN